MSKKYYFLSGFFRSGNTVLSAILNQNPSIHSSPISSLVEHIWQSHLISENFQSSKANKEDKEKSKFLTSKMIDLYYQNIDKPIIFDRSKVWIDQDNIELIKEYINKNPKIIFTTRPFIETAVSFIAIEKNRINEQMNNSNFIQNKSISINDNIVDYLFSDFNEFSTNMKFALEAIDNPDNADIIHVVKYEDLLNESQKTMNNIYDFLKIKRYNHDFNNIQQIDQYNDSLIGFSNNLHKVRKNLSRSSLKVEDFLSIDCIEKYKNVRYF
jgi:hypothetical protein